MAKPVMRLSISNKDKSERKFKDYKGNERTSRYQSVGAIFKNEDGRLSVAVDRPFKFDPDTMWLNLFVNDAEDSDDEKPAKSKKGAAKGKKVTKKAPPPDDEDEDDGEDPFADD